MTAALTTARREPQSDPESQLQRFIEKFEPEHQQLIRACRTALQRRLPSANELVYDKLQLLRHRVLTNRAALGHDCLAGR